jgi:hypothetical protein
MWILLFSSEAFAVDRSLHDPGKPRLGINFSHIADWNPEMAFVNLLKNFRSWTSQTPGSPQWNDKRPLDLDELGYVKRLLPDQQAISIFGTGGATFPAGVYLFLYDGEGEIVFGKGAYHVDKEAPGRWRIHADPAKGRFELILRRVDPSNYPRNMRLIPPGYHDRPETLFRDEWLAPWKDFQVYRFLNWGKINGSPQVRWEDRARPGIAFYGTDKGVPLEVMIQLCNQTGAHPWLNIPHQASDDYVRQMAMLVRKNLDPRLVVYLEYSNESWNNQFSQTHYMTRMGKELGLSDQWFAGAYYYARRVIEVVKIWEEVFGGHQRIVRVAQTQAANRVVTERIFENPDLARHLDALAVGPYIGMNIQERPTRDTPTPDAFAAMSVEQIFEHLFNVMLPRNVFPLRMKANFDFAAERGLALIAYEGGQSLTLLTRESESPGYKQRHQHKIVEANRHPLMEELYRRYLGYWREMGGGTFCAYSSMTAYADMCFGALWEDGQDPGTSPKYRGLKAYLDSIR